MRDKNSKILKSRFSFDNLITYLTYYLLLFLLLRTIGIFIVWHTPKKWIDVSSLLGQIIVKYTKRNAVAFAVIIVI